MKCHLNLKNNFNRRPKNKTVLDSISVIIHRNYKKKEKNEKLRIVSLMYKIGLGIVLL